ncbi:MAG TPA: 2-keto-4-pentenoate hydratase [Synergistaceae bacterium]|nr:2-keto-4-pentenoate hydratase [Synergistaceae bacterium]
MLSDKERREIAHALAAARRTRGTIAPVSETHPGADVADAYAIQLLNVADELAAGRRVTGKKIGLTSLAMQKLINVDQPDYGHLFDDMAVADGGAVTMKSLIAPKVEGEITFVLGKDLVGPGVTAEQALDATEYVVASIEIVDSRVQDWRIKLVDTVADNGSSALYVLGGKRVDPRGTDLKALAMKLVKNGQVVNEGVGADVLGDPSLSVAWLANALSTYGVALKKGEAILSGALTAALPAEAGDVFTASFTELGDVTVRFE